MGTQDVTAVWLALCSVGVCGLVLAWDAFRRWLVDRREARAAQRQDGALLERLETLESATRAGLEHHGKLWTDAQGRLLSLERAQVQGRGTRR